VATKPQQPAAPAPQSRPFASDERRQRNSSVRRLYAQEANGSEGSARTTIPSSSSATPDVREPRPRQGARDKANRATSPPLCAAAPAVSTSESSTPPTPPVCSNLSSPLKRVGQVAPPGTTTQFTVGCLIQVVDMLRRLDERAKAEAETPSSVPDPEACANHGVDRAGSSADPGPLGTPTGHRGAPEGQDEEQIEPSS
jgi:hypothetical protein